MDRVPDQTRLSERPRLTDRDLKIVRLGHPRQSPLIRQIERPVPVGSKVAQSGVFVYDDQREVSVQASLTGVSAPGQHPISVRAGALDRRGRP